MWWMLVMASLAGEDGRPEWTLDAMVEGVHWTLEDRKLARDGVQVANQVLGEPVFASGVTAFVRIAREPVFTELVVIEDGEARVVAGPETRPDRVALSPDARTVAYVSGKTGLASVYVRSLVTGVETQLTNTDPGVFVPPPREAPWFQGEAVCWAVESPDATGIECRPWSAP